MSSTQIRWIFDEATRTEVIEIEGQDSHLASVVPVEIQAIVTLQTLWRHDWGHPTPGDHRPSAEG